MTLGKQCLPARVLVDDGASGGKTLAGIGILGAAIVSSLAGTWGLAEVFGWPHTLNDRQDRATAKFYLTYALAHSLGAVLALASVDLVGTHQRRASAGSASSCIVPRLKAELGASARAGSRRSSRHV